MPLADSLDPINIKRFSPSPAAVSEQPIIRLQDHRGRKGILQSIEHLEDGYIVANLSGFRVELSAELEEKLQALIGQPVRVARIFGKHYAARWRVIHEAQ